MQHQSWKVVKEQEAVSLVPLSSYETFRDPRTLDSPLEVGAMGSKPAGIHPVKEYIESETKKFDPRMIRTNFTQYSKNSNKISYDLSVMSSSV